jgi:sugar lactone lactonase YvrE
MKTTSVFSTNVINRAVYAGAVLFMVCDGRAQNLFVSTPADNGIYEFARDGTETSFIPGAPGAAGLAFDAMGNLYTSDFFAGSIYQITPEGDLSTLFTPSEFSQPWGLAFNSAGNLFATDTRNGDIDEITPGGVESAFASDLVFPYGLAFNSVGNLFVADETGNIYEFAPGGARSIFASSYNFDDIGGMAFDGAGNLYVVNGNQGTVYRITPSSVVSVFVSGVGLPGGLAFDNEGNLYVADPEGGTNGDGCIYKIAPDGDKTVFASGLNDPVELAFAPVPEPSVLALQAFAGLGVFSMPFLLRRKA